ncbi:MAG: hypothetical protein U0289_17515 [Cyclobacteriaceae bacterium]
MIRSATRTLLNASYLVLNYHKYLRSQYFSPAQLQEIQRAKLEEIIRVAVTKVPFYKSLAREIDFNNFTIQELNKFPRVSKDIIRAEPDQFIRDDVNRKHLQWKTTSGSSGKPFATPKHYFSDAVEGIMGYRAWSMGKNKIYQYRSPSLALRSYSPKPGDPIYKYDSLRRYWYLSPYHINEAHLQDYVRIIRESKATVLRGYPSSLYIFTLLLRKHNIRFPQIETLVCSSETLLPQYRKAIEAYWGISLLDWYGQNERTVIVQQCWAGNYHNNDEYGFIELAADGQIIATSLWNNIMPLIRYETRDKAIPYSGDPYGCPCGRKLSIPFASIQGRSDDIIVKDDGTMIPSINFYTAMEPFQRLDQFKLIQQADQSITLLLTSGERLDAEYVERIRAAIAQRTGALPITIEQVPDLPRSLSTEKVKAFESHFVGRS